MKLRIDERTLVLVATTVLVLVRAAVFVFHSSVSFNADEAIVGLMAKHLTELAAFPLFFYGQHYMLGVEAWLAALVFPLTGPTTAGLKLVMFAVNLCTALLLVHLLQRELGLRPWHAFAAAAFFIIPPPGTAMELMHANGGNIEPFLYVLLMWVVRRRPIWLGVVFAVGFLNREFTIYGLVAILAIEIANGTLRARAGQLRMAMATIAAAAVLQAVAVARTFASSSGPGTGEATIGGPQSGFEELLARTCLDITILPGAFARLFTSHLGQLFGGYVQPLADLGLRSHISQGVPGLWLMLAAALIAACYLTVKQLRRSRLTVWGPELQFGTYLLLVGAVALVARVVARCGELDIMRYTLLALFAPIGILALYLRLAGDDKLRRGILAAVALWAALSAVAHVRLIDEQVRNPPPDEYQQLADALIARGIRYARSGYWTAYHVTFLTREQVIVDSTDVNRIRKYRWIVDNNDTVLIADEPCEGGVELVKGAYWACRN